MHYIVNDGGRAAAGFKGSAGDCVTRAIAIATGKPYREVYDALDELGANERTRIYKRGRKRGRTKTKSSARTGIYKPTIKRYLESIGWQFVPTMSIGSGCKVHLADGELPMGRLIVSVSRHMTAVIDGVIHDTHNPQRSTTWMIEPDHGQALKPNQSRNRNGIATEIGGRCVYGYWMEVRS